MMRFVVAAAALTVAAHVLEALPLACDAFGASWRPVCAAVADNAVHGAVGFLVAGAGSYAAVGAVRPRTAAACALCACLVDADHFLAARSPRLSAATSLPRRPPAHAATFLLAAVLLAFALGRGRAAALVFAAVGSHHARDALRRGFELGVLGKRTRPLPWAAYVGALHVCALVVGLNAAEARVRKDRGGDAARRSPLARTFAEARRGAFDV